MKNLHWRCIHIIWYNGDSRGMTWRILCSQHHGWFRLVEIIIRDRRAPHLLMKIMAMTKVLDGQTWWIFWSKDCSASWAGRHLLSSPWRLLLMLEISICWKAILALPSLSPWVVHNSQIVKSKLILYAIWSRWSKGHFSENRGMVSLDPEVPCRDTDPCREDNKVVFRHRPCHHNCDHHYHLHDGIYLLVNNSSIWLLLAFWKH